MHYLLDKPNLIQLPLYRLHILTNCFFLGRDVLNYFALESGVLLQGRDSYSFLHVDFEYLLEEVIEGYLFLFVFEEVLCFYIVRQFESSLALGIDIV